MKKPQPICARFEIHPEGGNVCYIYDYNQLEEMEILYDKEFKDYRPLSVGTIITVHNEKWKITDICPVIYPTLYTTTEIPVNITIQIYAEPI
ncbi:hypothetical protein ACTHGU_01860 [Chitinophagaceae bacterium MMS25-I14]